MNIRADSVSPLYSLARLGIVALLLAPAAGSGADGQLRIPERPSAPLFQGEQGKQKTDISFDRATGIVTLKLVVQDAHGYFIPGIRRENFALYEDGVRQTNANVEIEHAPVSLGLLAEYGGHQRGFNKDLFLEISRAARQLLDELGRQDWVAIWLYGDTVKQLADFAAPGQNPDALLLDLMPPDISETNLYDALLFALNRMKAVERRRAIVLISSGVDTFSKATYEKVLAAAGGGDTPIYVIGLGRIVRAEAEFQGSTNPLAKVDWTDVDHKLQEIAKASGGRFYTPETTIGDLTPIYDDMLENLKVRYVITYRSSNANVKTPHTVRVDLIDPKTGKPLQIMDDRGRPVLANTILQTSYLPH